MADAAALLGLPTPVWTGALSTQPTNSTMVSALQAAITAGLSRHRDHRGLGHRVHHAHQQRDAGGHPGGHATTRTVPRDNPTNGLAYIGQELLISGQEVGKRLASLMKKGDTAVGVIAQPGSLNIQPRMDGATQALEAAGMKVMFGNKGLDSGASATQEAQVIPQFLQANGSKIQGIFAVDGGSTALLGTSLQKNNLVGKVQAGGFDLEPQTLTAIKAGQIAFTIDQSPYLQGFLPTLYLYLFQLSGGLVSPPTTDTGLKFVVKGNVDPYTRDADPVRGLHEEPGVHQAHRCDLRLTGRGTLEIAVSRRVAIHLARKPR